MCGRCQCFVRCSPFFLHLMSFLVCTRMVLELVTPGKCLDYESSDYAFPPVNPLTNDTIARCPGQECEKVQANHPPFCPRDLNFPPAHNCRGCNSTHRLDMAGCENRRSCYTTLQQLSKSVNRNTIHHSPLRKSMAKEFGLFPFPPGVGGGGQAYISLPAVCGRHTCW